MVTMNDHPATDDLRRWRRGEVGEDEMLAIAHHLATCRDCVTTATPLLGLERAANDLCDEIESAGLHPDIEGDLIPFVSGTATSDQHRDIEEHLVFCASCTERIAHLRALVPEARKRSRHPWLLALAAAIAIAVPSSIWLRTMLRRPPAEPPPQIARATQTPAPIAEGSALARSVRNGATIVMPPALQSVLGESEILRGTSAATGPLTPMGVVITSARPLFTWPTPSRARSVVEIFAGETEVARSPELATDSWRPPHDLRRGVTYTWTVRVEHDDTARILPAAPSPIARFHVLDASTLEALTAAERRHGDDHLLLGVLYARAGVEDEARAHLRRVTDPADAALARRALHDIDSWRSPRP
jgi:hypothetical protein